MKKVYQIMLLTASLIVSICVEAANDGAGKLTLASFAGINHPSTPDVVQIKIEGGFTHPSCSPDFAAVRKADTHLVSALLAAVMADKSVEVLLDPDDIYFQPHTRCTIYALKFVN